MILAVDHIRGVTTLTSPPAETGVLVGQQNVPLTIEPMTNRRKPVPPGLRAGRKSPRQKLRLTIGSREFSSNVKSWEDSVDTKLEKQLAEITVELLVSGETSYRANALAGHEWWLQRRLSLKRKSVAQGGV